MRIDDSIGFMISTIGRKLNQSLTLRFQPYDITSEQWSVLNTLTLGDGVNQRELSQRTEKDPTNVTRILDQLERKGWIRRAPHPEDRRAYLLYVTESGRELNRILAPMEAELIASVLASVDPESERVLREALLSINDHIQ
ncbi:MarR family winged helix-turn-helix transcriptional regulator [Paenibacillus mucilaginosus]|uniref:Transcriptional regulator, MarR family n=1 Tax=Paenibacillus mucilaginosus (strain KNP414) TaxID=1036673 RepID=F8FIG2_PAEMK|nr:MarR family transcriptional regulator [Paenibacillus mucilaginosus]AEI44705.1 transcriptional regulator, MarR family [Paenibacillus mucilaginosus KNP414]MCG7215633.1 MarR family transcriptional regulator [Paenibacillus mucilaginosus]WDM26256.1 MarR family transcriptional regulator [Paenibacillus mucilaginosus]